MKKNPKYRQGVFNPQNKEKYKGTLPILYRSGLELRFMKWVDANPNILTWGSETIIIPYQNPLTGRVSRYFTDFNITMKDKNGGEAKKFIIEVKPFAQTLPPNQKQKNKKTLRYQQAEYIKNQAKWQSARAFCEAKNSSFVILTEKHLGK